MGIEHDSGKILIISQNPKELVNWYVLLSTMKNGLFREWH
jgi:hypothetical protein